jgi:SAM-dependent methyltransferase
MATKDKSPLREHWERNAGDWLRFARTPGHDRWYENLNLPAFLHLLPPPSGWTLDVGCGEGRLTRELNRRAYRIVGLDASAPAVKAFREAAPEARAVRADAARLPFADASFELVIAFMSLINFDDVGAAMREVARVLAPGGRFCFAVVHPVASAGSFESREADAPFVIKGSYLDPFTRVYTDERDGLRMEFHDAHLPLSGWFEALERAGLLAEAVREPAPSGDFVRQPGVARYTRLPLYLHVRARRYL